MHPALREAASRVTARVIGSRFAKPLTRAVLAVAGLFLLAFIGKTAVAGAIGTPAPGAPPLVPSTVVAVASVPPLPSPAAPPPITTSSPAPPPPAAHTQATTDDPVILNTATVDDLRRLPGIGRRGPPRSWRCARASAAAFTSSRTCSRSRASGAPPCGGCGRSCASIRRRRRPMPERRRRRRRPLSGPGDWFTSPRRAHRTLPQRRSIAS